MTDPFDGDAAERPDRTDSQSGSDEARQAREAAAWASIVEHYGARPEFPDARPEPAAAPDELADDRRDDEPDDWLDEGHFVPPVPPPVVRPRGARLVAWFGLFGVPTLVLVLITLRIDVPGLLQFGFFAWFVGGFGYLVATMDRPHSGDGGADGWDDGAVL